MKKYKYIIVGAGVAGTTAAFEIAKTEPGSVLLIGHEPGPLYNRILLPHYLKGTTPREKLFVKKPEQYQESGIDLVDNQMVWELDPAKKTVKTAAAEYAYEKLLLATGSTPNRLPIEGAQLFGTFGLQNLKDADYIKEAVQNTKAPAVIGGSFIALEFIGMLAKLGKPGKIILKEKIFFDGLFDEIADGVVSDHIESLGFEIIRQNPPAKITGEEWVKEIELENGDKIQTDFVGIGIGVHRNLALATSTGLKTNRAIITDEFLQTSYQDIYAAGDVAEFYHPVHGDRVLLGNWTNSLEHGKTAAANMLGEKSPHILVSNYSTSAIGINIQTYGETKLEKADEVIARGSREEKSCARIFIKDKKIAGTVLVNRLKSASTVSKLIKDRIPYDPALLLEI